MTDPTLTEPRKRPQQARSRALVDAMLDATERVLAQAGFQAASTTQIAEVAGVSVGSLYQYFPSREALVAAVVERRAEHDQRRFIECMTRMADAPLVDQVRAGVELLVESFRYEPNLYRAMVAELSTVDRERHVDAIIDATIARMAALLSHHRAAVPIHDPELTAYTLVTAQVAVVRDAARRRPELLSDSRLVDELGTMALRYLGLQ